MLNILISNKNEIQVHSDQSSAYDAWKGIKFCNFIILNKPLKKNKHVYHSNTSYSNDVNGCYNEM